MPDTLDIYSDQIQVNIGPYGSTLNFMLSSPLPPPPGSPIPAERLATVRMSLEHLKTMLFIIRQQLLLYERQSGVHVDVPASILNSLNISREDWDWLWKQ